MDQPGGPECLQVREVDSPRPSAGQILIDVEAASINPIDTYVRSGAIEFDLPAPYFPGCDAAGHVAEVGDGVKGFDVGDRVWCTNQGLLGRQGTLAERIAVDAQWCYPTPEGVSSAAAAASALVGVTAHLGLFREAQLQAGETILVIGASGGVGSMVVQMAKAAGATVIGTAGSTEKVRLIRELGVDVAIDYRRQSIADVVGEHAAQGVNVFWETRRTPDFELAVGLLADRGRMILMAGRDARPEFPVGPFYVKECSLHGFVMFKATPLEMRTAADKMNEWMAAGKVQANIAAEYSLEEAAKAHRHQESATVDGDAELAGKIVIHMAK